MPKIWHKTPHFAQNREKIHGTASQIFSQISRKTAVFHQKWVNLAHFGLNLAENQGFRHIFHDIASQNKSQISLILAKNHPKYYKIAII